MSKTARVRYWAENRRAKHKARNVRRFEKMVADSRARRARRAKATQA